MKTSISCHYLLCTHLDENYAPQHILSTPSLPSCLYNALPVAVVVELIIWCHGDQPTPGTAQWIEDLGGCISPYLTKTMLRERCYHPHCWPNLDQPQTPKARIVGGGVVQMWSPEAGGPGATKHQSAEAFCTDTFASRILSHWGVR